VLAQQVSPPVGRDHARGQQRAERRLGQERLVGVPHAGDVALLGVEHADLLEPGAEVGEERVDLGLAELRGETQVLRRLEVRGPHHEQLVVEQRLGDARQRLVVERAGEVDAVDHRAERAPGARDLHGAHRSHQPSPWGSRPRRMRPAPSMMDSS
jgi:hypothetical protein